jgi:hypothetical protein
MYLKNKVEPRGFTGKSHEGDLNDQGVEIQMLRHKLLEQEKMIFELKIKGMYAFCVCVVG